MAGRRFSRRRCLATLGGTAVSLAAIPSILTAAAENESGDRFSSGQIVRLSDHLAVYQGPINVGILRDGEHALLVDCGDGSVAHALQRLGITSVEQIAFTHHHRDQACGAHMLAAAGAKIAVPAAERPWFEDTASYWDDPKRRWHIYDFHPHHLMLTEPLRVDQTYREGATFEFGPAKVQVLATPGHTDGSLTYLVDVDGLRIAFCGDAIFDEGRLWELYSLQKGTQTRDYHGFLGARPQLVESLRRIIAAGPGRLVPSHGHIISEPAKAVDKLVERLNRCYDQYVAVSALRHYYPKLFTEYAGRKDHMPIRPAKAVPNCLRHFNTTWMLVSKDKAALVMDCGAPKVVPRLQELLAHEDIRKIEGLWITHYHDDHVNSVPAFQSEFDCPCVADRHVAEVISDPLAWRLPCISPSQVCVDRATDDGESWDWHEFKLTAYHLPGQTLYHGGLLVQRGDLRMFFAGDSFTMAGIDDYCAQNRVFLGPGVGFDRAVALIEKLRPTHIFNCHVDQAFDFTPEDCRFMRENLAQRVESFGELFPWDDPNYGMDESWVRCDPYEQEGKPGSRLGLDVVFTNHSSAARPAACRAVLPRSWKEVPGDSSAPAGSDQSTEGWTEGEIVAKHEGRLQLSLHVPQSVRPGRYVIPIDVRFAARQLPQFTEAIVVVR